MKKLTVILDIDQTLVYSSKVQLNSCSDSDPYTVFDSVGNETLHVYNRPYLNLFLDELFGLDEKGIIQIATYTAGTQEYADLILKQIDPEDRIKHRFYRQDCLFDQTNKILLKDLYIVNHQIK